MRRPGETRVGRTMNDGESGGETKLPARPANMVVRGLLTALPVGLTITTFGVHLRPEFIALSALSVAVAATFLAPQAAARWSAAAAFNGVVAPSCVVAAVLLSLDLLAPRERIPLLDPPSVEVLAAGAVVVLASLALVLRNLGVSVTLIVCTLMAYALFGHLLAGAVGHGLIRPSHFRPDVLHDRRYPRHAAGGRHRNGGAFSGVCLGSRADRGNDVVLSAGRAAVRQRSG